MSARTSFMENGDGDPSDDDNVQVIISPSSSSSSSPRRISTEIQQQEPTVPGEEELMRYLKQELRVSAFIGLWGIAKPILDRYPELVRIPLTNNEGTALHIAVSEGNTDFVRELVNYENVIAEDLEIRDAEGNTAFCLAAITGKREFLEIMFQKNENLLLIHGQHEMLPVHLAILCGYHEIVEDLFSKNILEKMALKDIQQLFFMALSNGNTYGVAKKLVKKYPESLSIARDDEENLTALHLLARRPPENSKEEYLQGNMLFTLWEQVMRLEDNERLKLITKPTIVMFDAVKSGNILVSRYLTYRGKEKGRELMMKKDPENGQNVLHIAILFRHNSFINFILNEARNKKLTKQAVDKDRNNVLHFAARQLQEESLSLRPDIRMRSELEWFKGMEKRFPELRLMRNKDGMTPNDMFYANHRKLSDEVKDTAKAVANSGMVVAALVVTVAFAAALTTPGGDKNNNAWFAVFIITNAVALFTSSLSILAFLSLFTSSRFKESHFVISLYPNLIIGKLLLFISVVAMFMAFAAATFLIFDHIDKWIANVVASMGLLTIIMFLGLQLSLFDGFVNKFCSGDMHAGR